MQLEWHKVMQKYILHKVTTTPYEFLLICCDLRSHEFDGPKMLKLPHKSRAYISISDEFD